MKVLLIKQEFKFMVQNEKFILSILSFSTLVEKLKKKKLIKPDPWWQPI